MSTKKEYLKDNNDNFFAPISSLGSLDIPDGSLYCCEDDMSFNFKIGNNIIKIKDNGEVVCNEIIEKKNFDKITGSNSVYAKFYDTDGDGVEDTLVLADNPNFTYAGTLIEDFNNVDNSEYQYNSGGSYRSPIWSVGSFPNIKTVDIITKIMPTICYKYFYSGTGIESFKNLQNLYTNNVVSMREMFYNNESLTNLDLSSFDTSNVTDMEKMFCGCTDLETLNVSKFDMSKVTTIKEMFCNCRSISFLDVKKWNTSKITSMRETFYYCVALEDLDVSEWDTSRVTTFYRMFSNCLLLETLDTLYWNTSAVTEMGEMFYYCSNLKNIFVENWNTTNVIDMSSMFANCSALNYLGLGNWDTSNVTNMAGLFQNCNGLSTFDLTNWDTSEVVYMDSMFARYACYFIYRLRKF